jgi:hypothetical protein
MGMTVNCLRCGRRRVVEARQADLGVRCRVCRELMDVDRSDLPGEGRGRAPQDVRPWTPWQLVAASVVFGAGACGAVAGLNFARLGKRQYLIPSVVVGAVLFVVVAWLALFLVPDEAVRPVGLLANLAIGFGFMLVQKPFFEAWKAVNWSPKPGDPYRPNGLGQLWLVSLVSLGLEIGVVVLLLSLGGTW